ncbi:MAG: IS1634 family transposase [Planctomycetota bacterium]
MYTVSMYIDIIPNRKSPPAVLLRESIRAGNKVSKHTLANLSALSMQQVEAIRRVLKGENLVAVAERFEIVASALHGHVEAVRTAMKRLGLEDLIASRSCRERDLIMSLIAARILEPDTKLATTRWWHTTTLPSILGVSDADEDDLYDAMDWLLDRQTHIEKKLAARHLRADGLVLYDLSSSYFEGSSCPLAKLGHNRDGKKGKLQVNYGLLTDARGCPVAVSVFDGNTGDSTTVIEQVRSVRQRFGVKTFVAVGDRGMISQKQIDELQGDKDNAGIDWITALKTQAIRNLVEGGALQLDLFDERNLFELTHPDYPGERLVACRNPELRKLRAYKRQSLLEATVRELKKVQAMARRGKLKGKDVIGVRVGKVVNKYKVAKHFVLDIRDDDFEFSIDENKVAAEASLDGVYVIRTSLAAERISAADTVRSYKLLSQVERAFRSMKTMDLKVRPIHHHLEKRVRAHIFLCMLAYYVEWHMREALRSMLFCDEDQDAKKTRDPVAPAKRSEAALKKAHSKLLEDGSSAHSFQTLLKSLGTIVRNTCRTPAARSTAATFEIVTTPNVQQRRAYDLLEAIKM